MKAKSWKKFIDKDKRGEILPPEMPDAPNNQPEAENPLETAISQNSTLKNLMKQRELLEKKMANITGDTEFGSFAQNTKRYYGEIPSHQEKKKQDLTWENKRKQTVALLKQKRNGIKTAPTGLKDATAPIRSNVTSTDTESPSLFQRIGKKKEKFEATRKKVTAKKDDFLERKAKAAEKLKRTKKVVKKAKDGFKSAQKELDRFADAAKEFGSDNKLGKDITELKDRFGTDSKLDKKLDQITDSFKKKRGGEKLDQKWEKTKNKYKELNRVKSKYEARKKRLLNVDSATLEELDEKRKALQEKRMEKKRQERKEEEKREKRKEERKRQKKERF